MSADDLASSGTSPEKRETPHTFSDFDAELKTLRNTVLTMAEAAIESVEEAMRGLVEGSVDRCNAVIADDEVLDQQEKDIGEIGTHIMMRFRPVATDLRRVLSSMNMARMLERIGDHAVNIARGTRKILKADRVGETKLLEPLFAMAVTLLRDAVTAFADDNEKLALELQSRDKELDRLHKRLTKSLSALIEERQEGAAPLIHLLFVSRSLERIGDLAVNLGEEVVFIELAEDIRHANP